MRDNILGQKQKKKTKYKKVVYEEKSESKPEVDESQCTPEEKFMEEEKKRKKKQPAPIIKNKTFEYLNKDVKRKKR